MRPDPPTAPFDRGSADRGMVTAELAVAMLGLVVVLAILLFGIGIAATHVRVQEAARVGARAAARGELDADIRRAAAAVSPGSTVYILRSDSDVRVEISVDVEPVPGLSVAAVRVKGQSTAAREPS